MSRWRALVDAFLADVGRNPTWYAIVGYVAISAAQAGIRSALTERSRTRAVIEATRRDIAERAAEIETLMIRARKGEHDATYDVHAWDTDTEDAP